jgi:hypothetical protein
MGAAAHARRPFDSLRAALPVRCGVRSGLVDARACVHAASTHSRTAAFATARMLSLYGGRQLGRVHAARERVASRGGRVQRSELPGSGRMHRRSQPYVGRPKQLEDQLYLVQLRLARDLPMSTVRTSSQPHSRRWALARGWPSVEALTSGACLSSSPKTQPTCGLESRRAAADRMTGPVLQ